MEEHKLSLRIEKSQVEPPKCGLSVCRVVLPGMLLVNHSLRCQEDRLLGLDRLHSLVIVDTLASTPASIRLNDLHRLLTTVQNSQLLHQPCCMSRCIRLGRHLLVGIKDDLWCAKLQRMMLKAVLGHLTRLLLQNLRVKDALGLLGLNSLLDLGLKLLELELLLVRHCKLCLACQCKLLLRRKL